MKWSDHDLSWGRPLRSIFLLFNNNKLPIKFEHLDSVDYITIENDLNTKKKKVKNFKEYISILKSNKIFVDQSERKKIILQKINSIGKSKKL